MMNEKMTVNTECEFSENELQEVNGGVIGILGYAIAGAAVLIAGKAVQEGTDYMSCTTTGRPFWVHKNQNYCDKYNK